MHKTDLISDIFATLRFAGEICFRAQLSGPFSVVLAPSQRHIRFHIVLNGSCWLCMEGEEPIGLEKGDILLVPHGATQSIKAAPDLAPVDLGALIAGGAVRDGVLKIGEEREKVSLLCGFLHFDEEIEHPVLALLPSHLHLRPEDMAKVPWMRSTLDLVSMEANRDEQGMAAIVSRLIEVIFIQTVRQLAQAATDETKGFLRALSDKAIARSLSAIHAEPEKKWRVEDLAALAGQSRSAFARNFAEEVGQTPMDYLRSWRLNKARMLLTTTNLSMGEVAIRCGYDCVPSFSRSFKRAFRVGPGSFRRKGGEDRAELETIS